MTVRLGVDFGTSTTVAVLGQPDGSAIPLLFDGSPLLPSAVFAPQRGDLLVGQDAWRSARMAPARFEPNPKRRIDDGSVLLGDRDVPVPHLIAAVLARIAAEASRAGDRVGELTMTYPVAWGGPRRAVLEQAAEVAGLPPPRLTPEPVAAAAHFSAGPATVLRSGTCAVVYDFGAGTFDATVVRRHPDGFDVLATAGLPDVGGLDIDAAVLEHLREVYGDRDGWRTLTDPRSDADRRALRQLWDDVRGAKELLSRASSAYIPVPPLSVDAPLGRERLDELAAPLLARTVQTTRAVIRRARVPVDAVLLVGGSSRMPAVATLLHREIGVAPSVTEWPELVVARGALAESGIRAAAAVAAHAAAARAPAAHPVVATPPEGPAATERRSWRRPAAVGAAVVGSALVAAVMADRSTRQAGAVGLFAPAGRTLFPVLAATVLVLGAGRFRRRRLLPPLPGDPPTPLVAAAAAVAAAAGWAVVQASLAAALSLGFVTPEVPHRLLVERAGPLGYATLAFGLAAAGTGVWLLAGAVPPDPLEPPIDRLATARRLVAAGAVGGLLAIGAHTHLYGNRMDAQAGAVDTARATDDSVLFLARTFSQPTGALHQLALAGAYLLGVACALWLLALAVTGARRLAEPTGAAAGKPARPAARYVAGLGTGLLVAAGLYLAYHAFREIGYWAGWRHDAGGWTAPRPVHDPVLRAGGWLWAVAGPVVTVVAAGLAAVAVRPRRWPWSGR